VLVASLFAVPAHGAGASAVPYPHASAAVPAAPRGAAVTHGDLVVGPANSPFVISPGSANHQTYYQGGNVTVLPGGKLVILQTTFAFVQYIGSTGSVASRLGHIYTFNDQGTVWLESSVLTDELGVLNAYPKVTLNVSAPGQMYVNASNLAFAGWVNVYGAGAGLWVNSSTIGPNPQNALLPNTSVPQNSVTTNDSLYAPALSVLAGAQLTLDGASETGTYADNWTQSGAPDPLPLDDSTSVTISSSQSNSFASFATPSDPLSLLRDSLYRTVTAGSITIDYTATVDESSTTGNSFVFTSPTVNLGTIDYPAAGSVVSVALPAAALAQINSLGVAAFFAGAASGAVSVGLGTTNSATPVTITLVEIDLTAGTSFNITADGTGTVLTAVDSSLDINWYPVAPFPRPPNSPPTVIPWASKKVIVQNHAEAFVGNLSIRVPENPANTTDISAILPDATSTVNLFRWMFIPVLGAGSQPVAGGTAVAYYSYDASQTNNATATALNNFAVSDPALAGYLAAWDSSHNVGAYGETNPNTGYAGLLLASGVLTFGTLQNGLFLGGYHVVVTVSGGRAGGPEWFTGGLAPYPTFMNPASADVQSPTIFPLYRPELSTAITTVSVGVGNGTPNTNNTLAIGEFTNFTVQISNIGTGAVGNYTLTLEAIGSTAHPENVTVLGNHTGKTPLAVGASVNVTIPWVVNESVTGIPHPPVNQTFLAIVVWNHGVAPIGGLTEAASYKIIEPSYITLKFAGPGGQLTPGNGYIASATVLFSGSQPAWINVTASSAAGLYVLSSSESGSAKGQPIELALPSSMANGVYSLTVTVYHQGRIASLNITNAFTVGPPPAGPLPWYEQKLLGLIPIWLLIVIVAAAVAAVVGVLFVFRRQAKGKLVECGECGNLIPEDATTCPKCGAEFETDLVRCSRCGSTIPANSQVCPECAAQLLGKGETETTDPERQGYGDFVERFRGDARKELGPNYNEGAFWDWWKRQATYLPFSQWKSQQSQGSRAGMGAPPEGTEITDQSMPPGGAAPAPASAPKRGGGPGAGGSAAAAPAQPRAAPQRPAASAPTIAPPPTAAPAVGSSATPPPVAPMKACSNCGKEIPPEYLVCPFCGAVTQ
jgi:RNA polymerase subunit RPABC4/transcription elongation factor Spt4